MTRPDATEIVPNVLQRLSTDEYDAPPYDPQQRAAVHRVRSSVETLAAAARVHPERYASSRLGTAAGLRALNESFGVECYDVPPDALVSPEAADAAIGGDELVIDVQVHYMTEHELLRRRAYERMIPGYQALGPDWWAGLEGVTSYSFRELVRCIFVESDTAVGVLTAPPADEDGLHFLTNEEMALTREIFDRFAGTGRLLNHTVVHPTEPHTLELMERWRDDFQPVGWKVYTMGHLGAIETNRSGYDGDSAWMLDDEEYGLPFLERARELGVRTICTHKGLSLMVDNGSPRDIGPCARMFPDLSFLVYHSGFEGDALREGPYTEATADEGINRLISTMLRNDVPAGGNVYAELGTTWYCMIKRPVEAAHVIGKLLKYVGEDNVLWGTDGIWYGATQPAVDAFRAFQIPDDMCEQFGYPKLTPAIRAKVLGLNAARVYALDVDQVRRNAAEDDLAWTKRAIDEYYSTVATT